MNGADLNSTALPWHDNKLKTKELFEEFYAQGDIERQMGREPIALMDRRKMNEQPKTQVDFLNNITIPCLQIVTQYLPRARRYLDNCFENLNRWKELMVKEELKREKLDKIKLSTDNMESSKPMPKFGGIEKAKSFRL